MKEEKHDGDSSGGSTGVFVGVSLAAVFILVALVLAVLLFRKRYGKASFCSRLLFRGWLALNLSAVNYDYILLVY